MKTFVAILVFSLCAFAQSEWTFTFSSGSAVSSGIRTVRGSGWSMPASLLMPASWTDADLLVEASFDGGATWLPVYDSDGVRVRIKTAANRIVILDASAFWALPEIRFRSVAVGGTVDAVQAAQRTLRLLAR